jgi:protein-disulfide isomerase
MRRIFRVVLWMFALTLAPAMLCHAAPLPGKNPILEEYKRFYHPVSVNWDPKGPDVIEFFSYNCNYCFAAEKSVKAFKDAKPATLTFQPYQVAYDNMAWQLSQYAFAAAYLAGVESQVHDDLFHRFNVEKRLFETKDDVRTFFQEKGLLEKVSPYLESKTSKDFRMHIYQMAVDYEVVKVPTFFVKGKYMVNWGTDQDPAKFAQLLIALSELADSNAGTATASAP